MKKQELGQSGIEATEITFGAWAIGGWMWGGADRRDAVAAIRASLDHGVTAFDTAPAYGQGLSEEITGEALQGTDRTRIRLLTKFGLRWDVQEGEYFFTSHDNAGKEIHMYKLASKKGIMQECEASLRRLKTDYIDLYQIHWPDATTPISATMEALQQLKEQGKILAGGVCNYEVVQMKEAAKTFILASNQVPYSMLQRDIEKEVVPYAQKHNMAIIAYSPLQRGLLTGKIKPGYHFNEGDSRAGSRFFTDDNIFRVNGFLDRIRPLANDKKATLGQLVIRWTLQQPGITIALVGARNAEQAIENAKAGELTLTPGELDWISTELSNLTLVG
jgi:aryl-alcohol dehydrogenase-like predicted oxidoreductase